MLGGTITLLLLSSINAFSTFQPRPFASCMRASSVAEEVPLVVTTDEPSIYERIGVEEDEIGMGIDPEAVLEWIGTRDKLEAKILEDNPKFDKSRVVEEASKLYMDADVLNLMIKFNEKMSDPEYAKAYKEMKNANRKVAFTYAGYIGFGVGFSYLNKNILQPKLDSGEWSLPFGSLSNGGVGDTILSQTLLGSDLVENIASAPAVTAEAVQSTIDAVISTAGQ